LSKKKSKMGKEKANLVKAYSGVKEEVMKVPPPTPVVIQSS